MPVQRKYDDEMRARAVRLYVERRKSDPAESQVASRRHVGGLIGVGPETLRGWVEREERNTGARQALPASEYYGGSAPPAVFGRQRTYPNTVIWLTTKTGTTPRMVPTFTVVRSTS